MDNTISKVSGTIKNWWVFLIIGILMIIGAIWMFKTPLESFVGLAGFFSILILLSGLFSVFYVLGNKSDLDNWGLYLAGGVLDVVVGLILLNYPQITVLLFSVFVGFWLLFRGITTISVAFKYKKESEEGWGWILLFGILIVIFAMMAILNPLIGAAYLVFTLAFTFLLLGIVNVYLAFKLKNVKVHITETREFIEDKIEDKLD